MGSFEPTCIDIDPFHAWNGNVACVELDVKHRTQNVCGRRRGRIFWEFMFSVTDLRND